MESTTEAVMLRVLVLMAEADGEIALQEQQMLQNICNEHFSASGLDSWHEALTSQMDLKRAATAIPQRERSLMLKLAYMLISACGEERGFPINPAELYAFNALVNHLELTEEQRERAVAVAKTDLGRSSDPWSMLRTQFSKHFGAGRNVLENTL